MQNLYVIVSYYRYKPTWERVRSLGNLKLLTKVSYISLILVPLLASIWSGIEKRVVNFNSTTKNAKLEIAQFSKHQTDQLSERIIFLEEKMGENINTQNAKEKIAELNSLLESIEKNAKSRGLPFIRLPKVWISIFLCALFVAIAHLIYEISCPQEIRSRSLQEFVDHKKIIFNDAPSPTQLNFAKSLISSDEGEKFLKRENERFETSLRKLANMSQGNIKVEIRNLDFFDLWSYKTILDKKKNLGDKQTFITKEIDLKINSFSEDKNEYKKFYELETGSKIEYKLLSEKNVFLTWICTVLYSVAIFFIGLIIVSQLINVLNIGKYNYLELLWYI